MVNSNLILEFGCETISRDKLMRMFEQGCEMVKSMLQKDKPVRWINAKLEIRDSQGKKISQGTVIRLGMNSEVQGDKEGNGNKEK